jgi:formamidopyrimidine-DNA glycosylase
MPELPEVETVRRGLQEILEHQPKLLKIELKRPDLRWPIPLKKLRSLEGEKVLSVGRRAKYLWFETSKGFLISHLGMTGSWRVGDGNYGPHDHVVLHFTGNLDLVFRDPRRFGILDFAKDLKGDPFNRMGPEPFSPDYSAEYLKSELKNRKAPIKNALMDQAVVVGIGNIYASEILFEAGIRPTRPAMKLSIKELENVVEKSHEVLHRAIEAGGSTLQDFAHTNGDEGSFQNEFKVYDRLDELCQVCSSKVKMKVMAGRSTYWCPRCQK